MLKKTVTILITLLLAFSCTPSVKKAEKEASTLPNYLFNGTVIRDNINMRAANSTASQIVGKVNDGDAVQVLENKNGWYHIITSERASGWVYSPFIGPENLSYALKSANFMEQEVKSFNAEMFIDENKPYKIIYLVLPPSAYSSTQKAQSLAIKIGKKYQQAVFPGAVEIRVMKQDKQNLFTKAQLKSRGASFIKAPKLTVGFPYSVELSNGHHIKIKVLLNNSYSDKQLMDICDEIAAGYGDQIHKIEVWLAQNNIEGRKVLEDAAYAPKDKKVARFYFLEDQYGPDYKSYWIQ